MSGRKLLVASLLGVAVVLAIVFGASKPNAVYSVSISEFLKRGMADKTVRISGLLVHGTLCKVTADCGYRFSMRDSVEQLSVVYEECVLPDTFRDMPGLDVVVSAEGERCQGCHDFKASQVVAKCPSKYEMKAAWSRPAAPIPLCASLPRM